MNLANTYHNFFIYVGSPLKMNSQMRRWKDANSSDIKVFIVHFIIGSVKKPNNANYWNSNELTRIEFFWKYMSRNFFQGIMANLHVNDNTGILSEDNISHDPLHKIRPMIDMCTTKFALT